MTTHNDILDTRCCCIRQALPPPEVYLMENIIMLGVFTTVHLVTFHFRWDAACIASLLGIYYGIYHVADSYSSVNKRYLECYMNNMVDEDETDDEVEDKPEDEDDLEAEEDADDEDGTEDEDDLETEDKPEDEDDLETEDKPEVCPRTKGGCGNRDETWCCPCRLGDDGQFFQPDTNDDTDYSDMPPLISLTDSKVMTQLQHVVEETNQRNLEREYFNSIYKSNENAVEQIRDTLNYLQDMITSVNARNNTTDIHEFKSLNLAKED
jgi:hypothetical protein